MGAIRKAVMAVVPYDRLASIVAAEIAVVYYALFSWHNAGPSHFKKH